MEIQKVSMFVGPGGDSKSKLSPFMMESQEIIPKLKKKTINSIRKPVVSTNTSKYKDQVKELKLLKERDWGRGGMGGCCSSLLLKYCIYI